MNIICKIEYGIKIWYNDKHEIHNDIEPAIECKNEKYWYQNGKLHRINGAAIECSNGYKSWYQNGLQHRIGGPAIEYADGDKEWWQNNIRHRLDGPAVEVNGKKFWYYEGKLINCNSQYEFETIIQTKLIARNFAKL
jgi:hypothetical protein